MSRLIDCPRCIGCGKWLRREIDRHDTEFGPACDDCFDDLMDELPAEEDAQ